MKKDKKEFLGLRRSIIRYNKISVFIFALFIIYAFLYSISVLDCKGLNFYDLTFDGGYTKEMITCTNMSSSLFAFFLNNHYTICIILLIAAALVLILQKLALLRINKLEVSDLKEEKVYKSRHIITTLLLGFTGLHKYRTENKVIGHIYLVNFLFFIVSWIIKNWFETTYNNYLVFNCAYTFSELFIIGIIILNIIEAIFSLASLKDDEEKIFA